MATESGGLSRDEFLLVQEQLLQLKNENYELREEIRKKNSAAQHQNSPKNEALQFASKLINRTSSSKKDEAEIEALRRKLEIQEEEFRLQQSTLLNELKTISSQNEELSNQVRSYSKDPSKKEDECSIVQNLKDVIKRISEEKAVLCEETIPSLKEELGNCQTLNSELEDRLLTMTSEAETIFTEKKMIDEECVRVKEEIKVLKKENQTIVDEMQLRNNEVVEELKKLREENIELQKELIHKTQRLETLIVENQKLTDQNQNNEEISRKISDLQAEKLQQAEASQSEISDIKNKLKALESENIRLTSELQQNSESYAKNHEKLLEDRVLLLETRFQLEVNDLKKNFEVEKEEFHDKIAKLEEKLKSSEEDKKLTVKKSVALVKELQKTLKEERKRADSYERKSEERAGWHVVPPENDRQSSHNFDGNESVSSLSAIESENVELITRLATLQKIHSENTDTILQLESENIRLRREVNEKGELIENLIREKPLGSGFQPQNTFGNSPPKLEVSFRKLLNTLGQDSGNSDVREMNKKLQRMLEETLSKNIILQRDLQTLMERTGL